MKEEVWSKVINESEWDFIGVLDYISFTHVKDITSEEKISLCSWNGKIFVKCSEMRLPKEMMYF